MISCVTCGYLTAKRARACPNCGQPWPLDGKSPLLKITSYVGQILFKIIFWVLVLTCTILAIWFFDLENISAKMIYFILFGVLLFALPLLFVLSLIRAILQNHPSTSSLMHSIEKNYAGRILFIVLSIATAIALYFNFYVFTEHNRYF